MAQSSEDVSRDDIRKCQTRILEELGVNCQTFAYPYGDANACGIREFKLIESMKFLGACTTNNDWISLSAGLDLFAVPRMNVSGSWDSFEKVLFRLSGWSVIAQKRLNRKRSQNTQSIY
ncbi:MAG: hypothetical protein NT027_02040 [Proteobacteria bacterium]|nr:hypothetical protein [Pseudomonadota bacterium]